MSKELVKKLLQQLDKNGDGKIDVNELKMFLDREKWPVSREKVLDFIKLYDRNQDEMLDLDELCTVLAE
ncbi:solute carrier family 25 (mitochondrial phosphate transporter) member 23/24/25/41 [Clonorchis sinensis]|uniref:Solute carrier family 25 (Mitochondrial phosphate transporter) member 23/24/25/41 n=1 Tax=Clonorchis sinensis TaxID=79923 RepID=G7Y559_CLOSI|nr:solute carrier family 25 (mitochondrial phosphate transporter) member 23/24/25/41 [Clonorchis sinensis]